MKLSTSLVAVKKITCNKPRSNFTDDQIEKAAKLILESEGVINPIVVRRTSLQSYEVVDGDFEYYAAARAREIDLRKGEMIGVFIIEDENEEALTKQIELFRNSNPALTNNLSSNSDIIEYPLINLMQSLSNNTDSRLTNIESRLENRTNELQEELKREIKNINDKLKEIDNKIPKQIEPLEALNTLKITELTARLKRVNVKPKVIEQILNEREKNGKYSSFSNVLERMKGKGLGDKTMIKIIDSFSESNI
ncbi:hypothetical protein NIES2100_23050 [Calothrix sp. NIES-2100]|uniref:ParB N-terminal domain-containing protein n=1 Tax=Calothrix sp. NIES-2100 TaxID=1954172 RepID=UPI000B5FDFC7|nr:hypothetical protein NIES2100_23050 [Calothrix sp. NIES-2100]